jgi:hypothetical protein
MKIFIATYVTRDDVDAALDDEIDRTSLLTTLAFAHVYSSHDIALDAMIEMHRDECIDLDPNHEYPPPPIDRNDLVRMHDHEYATDMIIVYEHPVSDTLYLIREIDTDQLND